MNDQENQIIPSIPVDWNSKFDSFVFSNKFESVFRDFMNRIEIKPFHLPEIIINVLDIEDNDLIDNFLNNFTFFYENLQDRIMKRIGETIQKESFESFKKYSNEELHIIIDFEDLRLKNRIISNFNQDLTNNVGRLCIFTGKFMNQHIERRIEFLEIEWMCSACGTTFKKENNFRCTSRMKPESCMKSNCKNRIFDDSDILRTKDVEHGYFFLGDADIKHYNLNLEGRIFRNIPYFDEKVQNISFFEDIKVLGVLRVDKLALFDRRVKGFYYYIEIIDFVSNREQKIDSEITDILKKKLSNSSNYREMLMDALFPFTWMIDIFYNPKIALTLLYISGGSWNEKQNFRDTINIIIGGGGSTFKSSLARNLRKILESNEILLHENKKITSAGLIGTTSRSPEGKTEIKHGVLSMYSNGSIIFDEAQELDYGVLSVLRCIETGDVFGIQDAINFHAPAHSSIGLIQNFTKRSDGYYDHTSTLFQNLSWKSENAKSLLERFDLFCNIPKPDKFTKLWIAENERKSSTNELIEEIYDNLEIDDFAFPNNIIDQKNQIDYVLRNYLLRAKQLYREIEVSEEYKDHIRKVYITAINKDIPSIDGDVDVTQRSKNSCYKMLKAFACLRLDEQINELDFDYFKLKGINLITAFRNSKLWNKDMVDMEGVFIDTLESLIEKTNPILITDHIDFIRAYLKRTLFTITLDENDLEEQAKIKKKIDTFIPDAPNLTKNYPYRKLMKLTEKRLEREHHIYRKVINKATVYYRKINIDEKLYKEILDSLISQMNEMLEDNDNQRLEFESILQILELNNPDYKKHELKRFMTYLIQENRINKELILEKHD